MEKLNKRQMIILAVAGLVVLYAVYELLIAGPAAKKNKAAAVIETASFVSMLGNDLIKTNATSSDVYVAERAEAAWNKSPFWDVNAYREFAGKGPDVKGGPKIVYSGYVDTGRKKMAIINGWEYEAGEALDVEGYILKRVTPSRVLIINRTTGGESYIPLQE